MSTATPSYRKLWVRESGLTATSVSVSSGELIDDVKTSVLSRYANSLGKAIDAANMILTIMPRIQGPSACYERQLSPDEDIFNLLDCYYPGGQRLPEALVISSALRTKQTSAIPDSQKQKHIPVRASTEPLLYGAAEEPATPVKGLTIREIQATPQQASSRKQVQSSHLVRSVSAGNPHAMLRVDSARSERDSRDLFNRKPRDLFNTGRKSPIALMPRRDSSPSEDASSRKPLFRRHPSGQHTPFRPSPEDRSTSSYFPPTAGSGSRGSSRSGRPSHGRSNDKSNPQATTHQPPKSKPKAKPQPKLPRSNPSRQLNGTIPPINVLIAEDNSLVSRVVSKQMQQLNVR